MGALPPPGEMPRVRAEDRGTRKPLAWWDRIKILLLLGILFMLLVTADMQPQPAEIDPLTGLSRPGTGSPGRSFPDAVAVVSRSQAWLLVLICLEVLRQIHYFISEHSRRWHGFWTERVFGRAEKRMATMNDWNRYRLGRFLKLLLWLTVIDLIVAELLDLSPLLALFQLPFVFLSALPFLFQLLFGMMFLILQFVALFWFLSRGGVDTYFPDDIKTRFTDVWGQDSVLEKIQENMVFLEDPESIEKHGGYVPGGLLLWGPPGTGKTLMAEAVAGETGKPFVFVDPGAFINMFIGVGVLKVKGLFRKIRKLALRYGGVIVFFDEADSLGSRGGVAGGAGGAPAMTPAPWATRSGCNGMGYMTPDTASMLLRDSLRSSGVDEPRRLIDRVIVGAGMGGGGMGTLQALLTELSGLKKPRGFMNRHVRRMLGMRPKPPPKYRILVMMATNMPQALDEALLRPGRIDRIYKVGYPSKAGRIRTYEGYLDKVSHSLTEEQIDKLATITPYATGATIKDIVNESLINAIREGREAIEWPDVVKAKQLKDLGPPEDVEYIERERHAVAIHEACHAVVAYRVRQHLTIDIATIEKGGTYLGMVASIPPEDQFTRWRTEYEADIMSSLAALAGERLFFEGDSSSGVSGDLENATTIATYMEGYWGMGDSVSSHGVTHRVGIGGGGRPGAKPGGKEEQELLDSDLGKRIEDKLQVLLDRARAILEENRREVLAIAHALETHKTVTGDDVEAIIEGREGPLIDGRVYSTPEFEEMAEAYHAQVVSAHKRHGRVNLPLPVLTAPIGPEAAASASDRSSTDE